METAEVTVSAGSTAGWGHMVAEITTDEAEFVCHFHCEVSCPENIMVMGLAAIAGNFLASAEEPSEAKSHFVVALNTLLESAIAEFEGQDED